MAEQNSNSKKSLEKVSSQSFQEFDRFMQSDDTLVLSKSPEKVPFQSQSLQEFDEFMQGDDTLVL
ncbi:MAG: hypothetical protein F6J93_31285 [Oscillatoria sp. SIO1A7]|nr:hypothetical protein [Oscillatoria sp. SIO1A7]